MMRNKTLGQHQNNPSYCEIPIIYKTSSSCQIGNSRVAIFLDIDTRDRVIAYAHNCSAGNQWTAFFSLLGELIQGRSIQELWSLSWLDYYQLISHFSDNLSLKWIDDFDSGNISLECFPLEMLRICMVDYLGGPLSHAQLTGQDESTLICRCFGVYDQEVRALLKKNPLTDVYALNDQLLAGSACGSCSQDLEQIITQERQKYLPYPDSPLRDEQGHVTSAKGLTPVELAKLLAPVLEDWNKEQGTQLRLMGIRGTFILLQTQTAQVAEPGDAVAPLDVEELTQYIKERLGFTLDLRTTGAGTRRLLS